MPSQPKTTGKVLDYGEASIYVLRRFRHRP